MPPRKGENLREDLLVFATAGPENHFFGYYDKSPLDKTAARLLCLRTVCAKPLPEADDAAEVGFWSLADGIFHKLAETRAFNWQQGAMLQWLGPDFERRIIFNDRRGGRFVSLILDTVSGETTVIPFPVYTVHPDGKSALSVDFERHYFARRNYAYAGIVNPEKDSPIVEGDGIFHVDFETRTSRLLISTRQMCEFAPLRAMREGANYLEHLMFSPSGKRFMFLHRWELADGGVYTRLYTAGTPRGGEVGGLSLLLDSGKATHACWRRAAGEEEEILCWGALPSGLGNLRRLSFPGKSLLKPLLALYHAGKPGPALARRLSGASFLEIRDADEPSPARLAPDVLTVDGHPSWNPVYSQWLVTDTYEDEEKFRDLILFNRNDSQRIDLGKFFSPDPFNDPPGNCDLHPRWDFSGRFVCVDSGRDGSRQMYLFDASPLVAG